MDTAQENLGNRVGRQVRSIALRLSLMRPECMKTWSFFDLLKLFNKSKITYEECAKLFGLCNAVAAMVLIRGIDELVDNGEAVQAGVDRSKNTFIANGWTEEECKKAVGKILAFLANA